MINCAGGQSSVSTEVRLCTQHVYTVSEKYKKCTTMQYNYGSFMVMVSIIVPQHSKKKKVASALINHRFNAPRGEHAK